MASREEIDKLYREELGRGVDSSGAKTYANMSADQIRKSLRSSAEYKGKSSSNNQSESRGSGDTKNFKGGYDRDQVVKEYRSVFGKDPDEDTIQNWVKYGRGPGHLETELSYKKNNTIEIFSKNGKQVDPGTEGATKYVIHKNEDAFYDYYGTGKNRMRFDPHKNTVHLAPGEALKGIGKGSYEFKSSEITEDSGFSNRLKGYGLDLLKRYGLDPNQYSIGQGVHKSANVLSGDIFSNLAEATGIDEFDKLGELVFDKWMPDELKFALDPSGTWGNFLDEDWSEQGLQAMSDTFGGDLEDWQKGQAISSALADAVIVYSTGGAAAPYIATKRTVQQANQVIGSGGVGADDFFVDAAVNATSAAIGANVGVTTALAADFAFNTAGSMAKGMDFGDSLIESSWATLDSITPYAASDFIRVAVDKDYRKNLESSPIGWASFAINQATSLMASSMAMKQKYGDNIGLSELGKSMLSQIGYGPEGFDFRVTPKRATQYSVVSERMGVPSDVGPSFDYFPTDIVKTSGLESRTFSPRTQIKPYVQTGVWAFTGNIADLLGKSKRNFVDSFLGSTPFGLLRAPSFTERGRQQRTKQPEYFTGGLSLRQNQPQSNMGLSLR